MSQQVLDTLDFDVYIFEIPCTRVQCIVFLDLAAPVVQLVASKPSDIGT